MYIVTKAVVAWRGAVIISPSSETEDPGLNLTGVFKDNIVIIRCNVAVL
jgi:hypothetical protein